MVVRSLIGSRAARERGVDLGRTPRDWDFLSDRPLDGCETYWDDELFAFVPDGTDRPATLDELYTIKALPHAERVKLFREEVPC